MAVVDKAKTVPDCCLSGTVFALPYNHRIITV